jgi:hypothetical protein
VLPEVLLPPRLLVLLLLPPRPQVVLLPWVEPLVPLLVPLPLLPEHKHVSIYPSKNLNI